MLFGRLGRATVTAYQENTRTSSEWIGQKGDYWVTSQGEERHDPIARLGGQWHMEQRFCAQSRGETRFAILDTKWHSKTKLFGSQIA